MSDIGLYYVVLESRLIEQTKLKASHSCSSSHQRGFCRQQLWRTAKYQYSHRLLNGV